jgi:PBP1b-binding outer membrane lipoprotein LpoB
MFYQITMKLLSIKTGAIVWQGEQQIRKVATRSTFGW